MAVGLSDGTAYADDFEHVAQSFQLAGNTKPPRPNEKDISLPAKEWSEKNRDMPTTTPKVDPDMPNLDVDEMLKAPRNIFQQTRFVPNPSFSPYNLNFSPKHELQQPPVDIDKSKLPKGTEIAYQGLQIPPGGGGEEYDRRQPQPLPIIKSPPTVPQDRNAPPTPGINPGQKLSDLDKDKLPLVNQGGATTVPMSPEIQQMWERQQGIKPLTPGKPGEKLGSNLFPPVHPQGGVYTPGTVQSPPTPLWPHEIKIPTEPFHLLPDRHGLPPSEGVNINTDHDVKSGAVASKDTNTVYIDPKIPPEFHPFLAVHEETEKHLMAGGMSYDKAHTIATLAERHAVQSAGIDWNKYTDAVDPHVAEAEKGSGKNPPPDPHVNIEDAIGHHADKASTLEAADKNIGNKFAMEDTKNKSDATIRIPGVEMQGPGGRGVGGGYSRGGNVSQLIQRPANVNKPTYESTVNQQQQNRPLTKAHQDMIKFGVKEEDVRQLSPELAKYTRAMIKQKIDKQFGEGSFDKVNKLSADEINTFKKTRPEDLQAEIERSKQRINDAYDETIRRLNKEFPDIPPPEKFTGLEPREKLTNAFIIGTSALSVGTAIEEILRNSPNIQSELYDTIGSPRISGQYNRPRVGPFPMVQNTSGKKQ